MLCPPAGSSSNTKCAQGSHPKTTEVLKVQRPLPAQEPRPGLEVRPGEHIVTSSPNESGTGQLPGAGAGVRTAHGADGSQWGRGGRLHAVSRHSEGPGGLGVRTGPGMGSEADVAAPLSAQPLGGCGLHTGVSIPPALLREEHPVNSETNKCIFPYFLNASPL